MNKKSYAARLGVLALALTLITTCLMGGTMARYVTEVSGSATAPVAAWSFDAKANGAAITTPIDLSSTLTNSYSAADIASDVIAPGTSGSFKLELDGTGSQVGIDYIIKMAAKSGTTLPNDLTFKVKNGADGSDAVYTLGTDIAGAINANDSSMKKEITVSWEWPFDANDTKDSSDNTYAGKTWTLEITAAGKQAELTVAP